uniref:ATP-binding cassette sub-family A member 3 n=1 Tax=Culex pipiens TaxID=7175 RepID=A0A8D8AHC9_CULPI
MVLEGTNLLKVFSYKCLTEKRRHPFRNIINTVFPIVVVSIFVFTRTGFKQGGFNYVTIVNKQPSTAELTEDDVVAFYPTGSFSKLLYAPSNDFTEELIEHTRMKLFVTHDRVESFTTTTELEHALLVTSDFFAIVFDSNSSANTRLSYTIRTKNNNFRTGEVYSRDLFTSYLKDRNEYFESGFLALQYAIERSFLELRTGLADQVLPEYEFKHVPLGGARPQEASQIYAVCIVVAIFVAVACTYLLLVPLVEEKASGMKEYLKIATPYSYWNEVAVFGINLLHLGLISMACVVISCVASVWELTAAQMVSASLLFLLFITCMIAYTFFISALLESVTIATIVAPICYLAPLILVIVQVRFEALLSIFPMAGFSVGIAILDNFQNSWHSFRAAHAFLTGYPGNERINLFGVLTLQLFGTLLWSLLWFYISNVWPGRYGTPKGYLFLFNSDYYQKGKNKINSRLDNSSLTEDDADGAHKGVMEEGDHLDKVVKISNLNKIYKTSYGTRTAVKNLSLKIYKNRITALLGHNGAGKTTTMNIITGMTPRTSGRIEIDGDDNASNYRQQIGFCPQHNVALGYMNCREHLVFFGALRGMSMADAERKADEILERVNLTDKSEEVLSNLSGGMKRRLCLANAIIGRTKLLILDEPTSGLDPESRRDIWDVLLKLKKDHTILITTHFMEEADVLGDWIAIMENGELIAFGTSIFLKHHYGKGYTLKLLKRNDFKRSQVMATIEDHVGRVVERPAVESLFAVTLPYSYIDAYAALLKELEDNRDELGIDSISITNATLEEVFLNSSSHNKALEVEASIDVPDAPITSRSASFVREPTSPQKYERITLPSTLQMRAIAYKKLLHIRRNLHMYGIMSALPVAVTILCFLFSGGYYRTEYDSIALHHGSIKRPFAVIVVNGNDRPVDLKNGSFFRGLELIVTEDVDVDGFLMAEAAKDRTRYHDQLVAAIEFNVSEHKLKVLHNNNLLHSSGIAINLASNLLLHYYGYPEADVTAKNSPSNRRLQVDSFAPYLFTEAISLSFMLYILQYLQLPYLEASTGFKQLHNVNRYLYWGTTLAFDFALHVIICLLVFVFALNMDRESVFSRYEHGQIVGILILYGLVALLVIYIVSQCVDKMDTAVTCMSYLMLIGVCGVFLLSDGADKIRENDGLILLLHPIPEFALKHSLRVVYENQKVSKIQALVRQNTFGGNPTWDGIKPLSLTYLYVVVPIMVIIFALLLNEFIENIYRREAVVTRKVRMSATLKVIFSCGVKKRKQKTIDQPDSNYELRHEVDDDVDAETKMVDQLITNEQPPFSPHTIAVHNLKKRYLDLPAVRGISFAVKRGECFGLLGMNGAGKTSTFQMITQNLPITDGTIYLNEQNVRSSHSKDYRAQYGYCPQGDSLLDFMTPYELVKYTALMKDIKTPDNFISMWLTDLDILSFAHSRTNECSGGTKRKVNTVLAMLGNPSIVFLDEPTTGVDPKSRHYVWSRIKALQRHDQTIILTSHSMDECEELCNRLSIMVDGQLRCIGFIQRLKEKYGKGFNLLLKLHGNDPAATCALIQTIQAQFHPCELKEEHDGILKFLVREPILLSELFSGITAIKHDHASLVQSFSINETSLEDIFLNFRPPTGESRACQLVDVV